MRIIAFFAVLILFGQVRAQVTSQCLEIENILVDACSPDLKEGQNEMVRILVGPNPLLVNSIVPTWPNHAFGGWIMNAVTAQKTAELNASVQSCGFLLEPLSGSIPANRKAILVTSWDMNTSANSFAGLSDTLYILYQNTQRGNVGHFANAGTGLRTLTINYLGCSESATYDRALLVGGDGAFAEFAQNGTATYGNNGCTAPIAPFSIDAGANPAAVCAGSPAILNGSVVGSYTYLQWSGGQGSFSSPSGLTTNYTPASGESGTLWLYFRVKGACPDTLRDSVQITVNPLPTVQINQSDFSLCQGSTANLSATANGSVVWSNFQTGNSITISGPGQYIAGTANSCGAAADTVVVTLQPLPSVQIDQADFSICPGANATISATGSGTVSWSTGQTGTSVNITSPGAYIASVTNTCGTTSDTITVSLALLPSIQINQSDFALCAGATATLTTTASGTVVWSTLQTGNSITISAPGQYIAGTANSCGSAADTVVVTSQPLPTVQITQSDFSICQGTSATVTATGSGTIFWNSGLTGSPITVSAPGAYIASVTNTCGTVTDTVNVTVTQLPFVQIDQADFALCPGSTAVLSASGSGPIQWSSGQMGSSVTISAPGSYVATVSNTCGSATSVVTVSAAVLPQVQALENSVSFCQGESVQLSATGNGTVVWSGGQTGNSLSVNSPGTYLASVTNSCGTATDTVIVTQISLPSVSVSASAPAFCGSSVNLNAIGTGTVVWNGGTMGNSFTATSAGTYVATVTNSCGSTSDTLVLAQGEIPSAQINGPAAAGICAGDAYTVSVQGTGNLIWSNGTNYTLTQAGTYFLVSQTACGTDTAFFTLTVSSPDASFNATPNMGNLPLTVQTVNQSTGAVSYLWNSGNGQNSVGQSPSFVYNEPGEYFLSLLITDANGCQDSAVMKITVQQNLEVFLPNVFTPNGDGVNDEYFAIVQGASEFRMMIYNRWGEPVFDSVSADLSWNGKTPYGTDAVNGVYFCLALVKDYYGKTHEYSTTVTLVR